MFDRYMKLTVGAVLLMPTALAAQTANISGIVNTYAQVTGISSVNNTVTVASAAGFSVGDRVLLIQMQGATINTTNTSAYGNVTDYANAGNYELNYVCDVNGNTITLERVFAKTYSTSGQVQLIRVPVYINANVTGTLLPQTWNGSTGGVLAIEVIGQLTLSANVSAAGSGFQAAPLVNSTFTCSWWNQQTAYYYSPTSGSGAWKGEGLADYTSGSEGGKGKQANGGGGGNDHNSGGGGGGNSGAGGQGGTRSGEGSFGCHGLHPGIGGSALSYSNSTNKVFMGGGGGAGHQNNSQSAGAGAGGGVVIIRAASIAGNNYTISAAGSNASNSQSDGASGGGGGGSVLLEITNWGSSSVNVDVSGGNGGNSSTAGDNHCMGPGGGGGGGVIWISPASAPGNLVSDVSAGSNGICMSVTTTCPGYMNGSGATSGSAGSVITDMLVPESSTVFSSCQLLPIKFVTFEAEASNGTVWLQWTVAGTARAFEVQRSFNGLDFTTVTAIAGTAELSYSAVDGKPVNETSYYRIKAISTGAASYSQIRMVQVDDVISFQLIPTMTKAGMSLTLVASQTGEGEAAWEILNAIGQTVGSGHMNLFPGATTIHIGTSALAAGSYLLHVRSAGGRAVLPFVIW
jgi:hypothetical protein